MGLMHIQNNLTHQQTWTSVMTICLSVTFLHAVCSNMILSIKHNNKKKIPVKSVHGWKKTWLSFDT